MNNLELFHKRLKLSFQREIFCGLARKKKKKEKKRKKNNSKQRIE